MNLRRLSGQVITAALLTSLSVIPASAEQHPDTNAAYHQLRGLLPGGATIVADNLVLKRDAGTLTFTHGEFALFGEVNGKVTGAVFVGVGHFHLTPPNAIERHNLEILTKKSEFDEDFSEAVLRFTDSTADELHKGANTTGTPADGKLIRVAQEFHTFQREHLFENIDLRLLEDVLSPATSGGFFLAAIKGSSNGHILFEIDPHGAPDVAPEEVRLGTYNSWGWSYPCAFHLASEYANGAASGRQQSAAFSVESEDLDTSIEKNGFLGGQATVHLRALEDGSIVAPLALFPTLRVSQVEGEHGEALDFVQEDKKEDSDFGLILAKPLKKGEATTVKITYGGKDAVRDAGNDNYDPVARKTWFPNGGEGFGGFTRYKMVFHSPKEDQLIATGTKLEDKVDGRIRTTVWDSLVPLPVVGFHLGQFAEKDGTTSEGMAVSAYANSNLPDWAGRLLHIANGDQIVRQGGSHTTGVAAGSMSTTGMLPVELSEATVAAQIYTGYFGKLSFDHFAVSQQPACNYGQSWPMLVYLPICAFWDGTIQNQLGQHPDDSYWKAVTAHEVAHQWWGSTVGFQSYRDQWMSEGFAQASAAMFLQSTRKSPDDYLQFWKELKTQLTQKNAYGFRPIDVGPVTMGFRLSTEKTGFSVYQNLVYPKGAYILHMIRMMMYSQQTGDTDFRAMMHDFVDTYRLKPATTEDFKAMVEKHMLQGMDLDHNKKMDWFFNEYVYGIELPHYHFEGESKSTADGDSLHFMLKQSGVSEDFKMLVPIYAELTDGRTIKLGSLAIKGNNTAEQTVPMGKSQIKVKSVKIDINHDVLAIEN